MELIILIVIAAVVIWCVKNKRGSKPVEKYSVGDLSAAQYPGRAAQDALSNHYYWLAHPYAGDHGGASKAEIRQYEARYSKWSRRSNQVLAMVEVQYANSFTDYIRNSGDLATRGPGRVFEQERPQQSYKPPAQSAPSEKPPNDSDFPRSVTGPGNETYYKMPMSGFFQANYQNDEGDIVTIHVSDIDSTRHAAHDSSGCFYW